MTTGQRIKEARTTKGMTQKELGAACEINEANIRKYESGRQNPKLATLQKIAAALDVPVYKIMGLAEEIAIAVDVFDNGEDAVKAAHDIFSAHDKDAAIALTRAVFEQRKKIVPNEELINAMDRFYLLDSADQQMVIRLINVLYENERRSKD